MLRSQRSGTIRMGTFAVPAIRSLGWRNTARPPKPMSAMPKKSMKSSTSRSRLRGLRNVPRMPS